MKLEHSFTVAAPVDDVWSFLMNIPEMAGCIPGASNINQVDDTSYDASVQTRIGPINAKFACRVAIVSLDEAAHSGVVELNGKDSKLGSAVKARMTMTMSELDGKTTVEVVSDADIMGKIGQYGHGMISKRADGMFADFASCVQAQLETRT